jgi:DNA mismatch repair protein MutS
MMKQFLSIKEEYKDCLLFYRMGDFYELFLEDAVIAAPILGVVLTKRGKAADAQDIPMCGIPHHSSSNYIKKLIEAGHKVAICDQLESPQEAKKRGHKSVVKRDVVRVITPGTLTEDNLLDDKKSNYLVSISSIKNSLTLSYADISTLEFNTLSTTSEALNAALNRINPSEIIIPDSLLTQESFKSNYDQFKEKLVPFADSFFDIKKTTKKLLDNFKLHNQGCLDDLTDSQISSCGALIEYISITQKKEAITINFPKVEQTHQFMMIDRTAQINLELLSSRNAHDNSLFKVIDRTITNSGSRLLKHYVVSPSIEKNKIEERLNLVEDFIKNKDLKVKLENLLSEVPDLERSLSKLSLGRGSPKDLYIIFQALITAKFISETLGELQSINEICLQLSCNQEIIDLLTNSLIPRDIYLNQNDFINHSYNSDLASLYNFRDNAKRLLSDLKSEYQQKTGISNLKIEYNNVIGYYVEVTKSQLEKITSEEFIHKQTMMNCSRYVTEKLKELEGKIFSVNDDISNLESQIFQQITESILSAHEKLSKAAKTLAFIDVVHSFATLSIEKNYCKPEIFDSTCFEIEDGRHPMVEHTLERYSNEKFVPNSCDLSGSDNIWLITGPNMAGKSTFLRQNTIIAILAHMGCYVPAKKAKIGIIDRIFCRVGAGDDLTQGHSTFLVEMIEAATILNQATKSSLIILDEIGRGTSTYDGMSIAFSCLEHIHNKIKARTLFSTHYHEMVELSKKLSNIGFHTVKVQEWENKIIFLHKVIEGVANKSYGIHVAELAGIPSAVIERAKNILSDLSNPTSELFEQQKNLNLFDHQIKAEESKVKKALQELDINNITPKEALDILYKLKEDC